MFVEGLETVVKQQQGHSTASVVKCLGFLLFKDYFFLHSPKNLNALLWVIVTFCVTVKLFLDTLSFALVLSSDPACQANRSTRMGSGVFANKCEGKVSTQ